MPDTTHPSHQLSTSSPPPKRDEKTSTCRHTRRARCQIIDDPPVSNPHNTIGCDGATWTPVKVPVLLRKEVIQPHLPVRLPCYDLVPIASPTFDGSPSCELGHRLRVLPTFVT